jgi:DNA-binding response OmpR family regulator
VPDGDAISLLSGWDAAEDRPAIFLVSGRGGGDGRVECLAAGADDSMAEPLDVDEFVLRVRKLIVRRTPGGAWVELGA